MRWGDPASAHMHRGYCVLAQAHREAPGTTIYIIRLHRPEAVKRFYSLSQSNGTSTMREGFYWVRHNGTVQVAYYTDDPVDDIVTGTIVSGIWHMTRSDDLCNNGEVEVLQGPLEPPL